MNNSRSFFAERRADALRQIQNEIGFDKTLDLVSTFTPLIFGDTLSYLI